MQLQFRKTQVTCLQAIRCDVQYQEQTQELRLPEEMPDIGSILGSWGQVLIRGKEWRSGSMSVNGGVMVWAMYLPEESGEPQMVEAWIPFQMRWDLPETRYDGVIRVSPLLKSVDARVTSARKLMLRACVGVLGQALTPMESDVYEPEEPHRQLQILEHTYPMLLPKEASEKPFTMEEDLQLPSSAPSMAKLLRFSLQPELIDHKVMSGKVVFRGVGILHILYLGEDGMIHSWDFEIPFSQYEQLEADYAPEATAGIWLSVTALELDMLPEGQLRLKAGLTGQYLICEREMIRLVEDAYATAGSVQLQHESVELPMVLEDRVQTLCAQVQIPQQLLRPIDIVFYPDQPGMRLGDHSVSAELNGSFQMLGYTEDGTLASESFKWNSNLSETVGSDCRINMDLQPSGVPKISDVENQLCADVLVHSQTVAGCGLKMVCGIELQTAQPDPQRPSLIVCRLGDESLWDVAKRSGSTQQAILEANHLTGEPEPGQMLLIPVL